MKNANEEQIVLRSDDPFAYHDRLKREEETRNKKSWNRPTPSFDPSKRGCDTQSYKKYYEDKNPWVEFG